MKPLALFNKGKKRDSGDAPTPKRKGFSLTMEKRENVAGWLFATPLILGLLLFTLVPMVMSLIWAFKDYDGLTVDRWIGFGNFVHMFNDDELPNVIKNTFVYTFCSIPINLILSYLLAWLVNNDHKFTKVFRVLYYLPCVIPAVVSGLLWKDITGNTYGIFNKILTSIGLPAATFFSEPSTAMLTLLMMNIWNVGSGMILWLSAFKGIPKTLYEAAKIDGANGLQRFAHITIPMSTPVIFFNLVTSVIGSLQYNGTMVIAGDSSRMGRGVEDSLYLYGVKIYNTAFADGQLGYASALAWVLCIFIAILTFILFKTSKWVFYGENQ